MRKIERMNNRFMLLLLLKLQKWIKNKKLLLDQEWKALFLKYLIEIQYYELAKVDLDEGTKQHGVTGHTKSTRIKL